MQISIHADEDIAGVLRVAADGYEELVNHFVLHTNTIIQAGPHSLEPTQLSPEIGVLQPVALNNQAVGGYAAVVDQVISH